MSTTSGAPDKLVIPRIHRRPASLIDLLRLRVLEESLEEGYVFLRAGETQRESICYARLERRAHAIAAALRDYAEPGDRAVLLYPPGLDFIEGLFGCISARAIAVPSYPPDSDRLNRTLLRLRSMVADAQPAIILTASTIQRAVAPLLAHAPELAALRWICTDEVADDLGFNWKCPEVRPDDLAVIQYTSGSTGSPKGVMLSHSNLLHNAGLVYNAMEHSRGDKYVSWLPQFHDMGFMAGVLEPLFAGIPAVLMSPLSFLRNPFCWLDVISRHKGTVSGGPNFAYDLCVRKIEPRQRATLDLSTWTVAFNGAEPIRSDTIDRFVEAFEPCGFRREAFYPCYGLAEATLMVSGGRKAEPPKVRRFGRAALLDNRAIEHNAAQILPAEVEDAATLVSCGKVLGDQEVAIVHAERLTACKSGEVGEIWVSGPSVALGYWNKPEESSLTFQAQITGKSAAKGRRKFLRTGDLGLIYQGCLFITGRIKDLVIIHGVNHYPQDIELTVERCHALLRPGCGAAFSVEIEGQEQLVVVQEIAEQPFMNPDPIIQAIVEEIAREHEISCRGVAFIRPGSIPKTSSGKIQRNLCKQGFLNGTLKTVAQWRASLGVEAPGGEVSGRTSVKGTAFTTDPASADELASWIGAEIASRIGARVGEIDLSRPALSYGLDSLATIDLTHKIESRFGFTVGLSDVFQSSSIAELSRRILADLPKKRETSSVTKPPLVHVDSGGAEFRLSAGQEALWFLHQLAPDTGAYNIGGAARIRGDLDVAALQRAFQTLADRHPSLRATFAAGQDLPVQRVRPHLELTVTVEEISAWSEATLNERLTEETLRPFDLQSGPLVRACLFRRAPQEHILLLVMHHIVADLWSLAILMNELGGLYRGRSESGKSESVKTGASSIETPSDVVQYADFVRWQRQLLESSYGEKLWEYWRNELAGRLPVMNLPTDRSRPPVQTYRGASSLVELSSELAERLAAEASRQATTLYTFLLAAFQVLLYRYTGEEDLLIGYLTTGRTVAELEEIVGYLANPVVVRATLSGVQPFESLVEQTAGTVSRALDHQDYPFALLVDRLQPDRDPSRSPIFQVLFSPQKAAIAGSSELAAAGLGPVGTAVELSGLRLESVNLELRVAQFDLTLAIVETDHGLLTSLQYNTDLFDAVTADQMAENFRTLLEGIAADATGAVSLLPLVSERQQRQILIEWNNTQADYDDKACLHELVEQQSERSPYSVAVTHAGMSLTYSTLIAEANRLARRLQRLGVGPDVLVGISIDRSLDLMVSLLAVLKAGGAYVPLDSGQPSQRLAAIIAEAKPTLLLTLERQADLFPDSQVQVLCLDAGTGMDDYRCETNPQGRVSAQSLCYVMYTSGSTGRPKGVQIPHGALVNFLTSMKQRPGFASEDRMLSVTPLFFDIAGLELYLPLTVGGSVILADRDATADPEQLIEMLETHGATVMQATPVTWQLFLETNWRGSRNLRVLCGGEGLRRELAERLVQAGGPVWNLYGPTETTVWSTANEVRRIFRSGREIVSIGTPINNTQAYVLDQLMEPLPPRVTGRLFIGGVGLARGYVNSPDLTAEKFLPDPFGKGTRLYDTGDMARHSMDGNLDFLGRGDHQIKLRGHRVELGEIESALTSHPAVREAAVLAREEGRDGVQLTAYLVLTTAAAPIPAGLHQHLKESLPAHMRPSTFVLLERMPLTPNAKVDRRALSGLGGNRKTARSYDRPSTPIEEVIGGIWADVLHLGQPGTDENFFECGGNSLSAVKLAIRIRSAFNVEMPVRCIFEAPTIAELASRVEAWVRETPPPAMLPILPLPDRGQGALSFAQERIWFQNQFEMDSYAYNMTGAVRLSGSLNVFAIQQSLDEILRRHEVLRTRVTMVGGIPTQFVLPGCRLALPLLDLAGLEAPDQEKCLRSQTSAESLRPFLLEQGPMLRAELMRLDPRSHLLAVTVHHIAADGWSLEILLRELAGFYEVFSIGNPSILAELPVQYLEYADWERRSMRGERQASSLRYWRGQFGGELPLLGLPTDRPRPTIQSFQGAKLSIVLEPELRDGLKAFGLAEGNTLFMTMIAGFETLLHRYTMQEDLVIGIPVANRNLAEVQDIIGCLVNTLVLRTDCSGGPSFRELQRRVRNLTIDAYAHDDLPFERLVEELQPERDLSRNPLFQVMAVDLQMPIGESVHGGVTFAPAEVGEVTAKFIDLTLTVLSTEGGLVASFEYDTDLFEEPTIAHMLGHLESLLRGALAYPDRRIGDLPMLTQAEARSILEDWNNTASEYRPTATLHGVVEASARMHPDRVALEFEEQQLTYGELDSRTNQLAKHLTGLGVGRGEVVGICLDPSLEMFIAVLGVLKAGGAYLPLDPAYPKDRLDFMIAETKSRVLLTRGQLLGPLDLDRVMVIALDTDWSEIAKQTTLPLTSASSGDDLIYVIYTSGSTGNPKAVLATHAGVCNHLLWMQRTLPLGEPDRMLQKYSFSFDAAAVEMFYPLIAGARVVVAVSGASRDSFRLVEMIVERGINAIDLVPSLLDAMLRNPAMKGCASLRQVTVGGEALEPELGRRVADNLNAGLYNLYGPTEASIGVTFYPCDGGHAGQRMPIGRPIANVRAYILDRNMQPLPAGLDGELYLGGAGIAWGYLNRPGVGAEAFVPDPFSGDYGGRLYRTGDLAGYLRDGNIEFLGRGDRQVKIRGFRIELGEIEAALKRCSGVRQAVVVAQDDAPSAMQSNRLNASSTAAPDLLERLMSMDAQGADDLLAAIEHLDEKPLGVETGAGSAGEQVAGPAAALAESVVRRHPSFEITLRMSNNGFIRPPRQSQKNWLVQRAIDEFADDLIHLDEISKRFVPGSPRPPVRNDWAASKAKYNGKQLVIEDQQVMQDWERPLMEAMARTVGTRGGDILEIGFGMGISASYIQEHPTKSHTIVECNDEVIEAFIKWKHQYDGRDIRLIRGKWQDVISSIERMADGVLFDSYPLSEDEFVDNVIKSSTFAEHFFPFASACLRPGGVFTYYTNEIDSFSRRHQRLVLEHFSSFSLSVVSPLFPPTDCTYWWADRMVVIAAVK
jgi:amino acid adenylation domain-containing protein